ncbi:hypothetical protein [Natronomonas sp. EA1]|uniref:hypothetical protein n=1 Tax=Natronomonas sp. EA1 TaxID=3421655 RepID=UPI003EB8A864
MSRLAAVAFACLLVASSVSVVAAQEAQVTISGTETTPEPAIVGETITVAPTVVNQQSSPTSFEIELVRIRGLSDEEASGTDPIRDLGTLTPGSDLRIPFGITFKQAGVQRFRIEVIGEDGQGNDIRLEYPVTVRVRDEHPEVSIRTDATLTTGFAERVNVTVSNGFEREIRSVDVSLAGTELTARQVSDGAPRIAGGEAETFRFDVRTNRAGRWPLTATVTYRTTTGLERTVVVDRSLRFDPLREEVTLDADTPREGRLAVPVTLGNFGNAPIENVVIRGEASNGSVSPVAVGTVPAGTTRRVLVNVSDVETRATVTLTASYDLGDTRGSVTAESRVVAEPDVPGEIELTGLDVEREDGRLHVTGTASNVGLRKVDSVIVRVRDTDLVQGVAPNREYFVGTVPASDFVSFDVFATAEEGATAIPLTVTYLSDGERKTLRTSVPYEPPADTGDTGDTGSDSGLLVYVGGAVVALLVVGIVAVGWRNRVR